MAPEGLRLKAAVRLWRKTREIFRAIPLDGANHREKPESGQRGIFCDTDFPHWAKGAICIHFQRGTTMLYIHFQVSVVKSWHVMEVHSQAVYVRAVTTVAISMPETMPRGLKRAAEVSVVKSWHVMEVHSQAVYVRAVTTVAISMPETMPRGLKRAAEPKRFKMEDGDNKVEVELGKDKKSYAGIPEADFVDDVEAFMAKPENESVDKVLRKFDENHGKYKFMEYNLANKRRRLKAQIPDLERSLEMIEKLQIEKNNSHNLETQFLLSEQVYAKAIIPPTDKVCLWLGANVMLEYTLDDAQEMLTKNIEAAKRNLGYVEHDLDFVRDQFTTMEVNMARIYNWEVKRRQAAKPT
ncbi:Prefoldin subunit 3 [Harpegnathos saltator]|uniref:Prefoldin subunit 3 n=2 Tax=Ponerini TaxID=141711 RepID=E2BY71_HARSA|nr:Prefoldin subunit 3 [Harpegnathos saltator]